MQSAKIKTFIICLSLFALSHCKEEEFAGDTRKKGANDGTGKKKDPKDPGSKPGTDPKNPGPAAPGTGGTGDDLGTGDGNNEISKLKKPKFAMMARDLRCGMCHLTIQGDLATVGNVMSFEPDRSIPAPGSDDHIRSPFAVFTLAGQYDEKINGAWFIQGSYPADRSKSEMRLKTTDGIKENYTGEEIPKGGFPKLDLAKAEKVAKGTLEGKDNNGADVKITGIAPTNVVLDGSKGPIKISGEVLIKGDVVIVGKYSGRGTIYASGNIYVAGNILATDSAFPYPEDKTQAMAIGKGFAESGQKDALVLAASSSIIFGDPNHNIAKEALNGAVTPSVEAGHVMSWYPAYPSLYSGKIGKGIKSQFDAYLFATGRVAGKIGNYVINGGMICDSFHILGTGSERNRINYDYRMANGLKVMEAFDDGF